MPDLSVVIPAFNEASNLGPLLNRLSGVLDSLGLSWEVIFVDDGSSDNTYALLQAAHEKEPRIKAIALSRNFGKEVALSAGLQFATGNAVIPMDADLQHPPETIADLLIEWHKGAEIVTAVRRSRSADRTWRRLSTRLFFRLFNTLSDTKVVDGGGDFRLLDRRVVDTLKRLPERGRFLKGLYSWVGFREAVVPYEVVMRSDGKTAFTFLRLFRYSLDALTSFSTLPLRIWSFVGGLLIAAAMLYAVSIAVEVIIRGRTVPGFATLVVLIVLLGGVQFLTLGIMGEYIGRIMVEVKARPLFIVRDSFGIPTGEDLPSKSDR
jgi:polyisoprenyl-phosphate glycosyltransferase